MTKKNMYILGSALMAVAIITALSVVGSIRDNDCWWTTWCTGSRIFYIMLCTFSATATALIVKALETP